MKFSPPHMSEDVMVEHRGAYGSLYNYFIVLSRTMTKTIELVKLKEV